MGVSSDASRYARRVKPTPPGIAISTGVTRASSQSCHARGVPSGEAVVSATGSSASGSLDWRATVTSGLALTRAADG